VRIRARDKPLLSSLPVFQAGDGQEPTLKTIEHSEIAIREGSSNLGIEVVYWSRIK